MYDLAFLFSIQLNINCIIIVLMSTSECQSDECDTVGENPSTST